MNQTVENVPHNLCTGCGACFNRCPKDAITMEYDDEGFLFPKITKTCINCGLCLKVCPAINPPKLNDTPKSYAVWASDEIRLKSSSGGMFSLLAEEILDQGGVVCGAAYESNCRSVHHVWATDRDGLIPLRGSKYVQSNTELTYRETKKYLEEGRPVLYTGCPCQIAGLYTYLGKTYHNLYTADLVCHGANSITAYQSFLDEFCEGKELERFDFRDKTYYSWSTSTVAFFKDGTIKKRAFNEDTWYIGFLNGIINRQNCFSCLYARAERISDITMADCWQIARIDPKLDDRKGTSLVLINTSKGNDIFKACIHAMKTYKEIPLEQIRKYNGQLNTPMREHPSRKFFFKHLPQDGYHKALWYGRGMRFDVGMVGWWFASNYGSCLTYYALGCILEELGKQIILIKLPTTSGADWDPDTKISVSFLSKYFKISAHRTMLQLPEVNHFCDSFMVGSDQLWRENSIRLVGFSFFLDFVESSKKKIAFSTSFGNEHFTDNEDLRRIVSDLLHRFDAISVREKSGVDVCKNEFCIDAQQLLDPVLLCKKEQYNRITQEIQDKVPERYLLCYILDPSDEKQKIALQIAKHENLEILTILGMKEYGQAIKQWKLGKILPKVSPEQFINYIKNCNFLFTDSHHGTCFGIVFHKQYLAFINKQRGSTRFETVAEALGLQNRLVANEKDFIYKGDIYGTIDYISVDKKLDQERDKAQQWLMNAFKCPVTKKPYTLSTVIADSFRRDLGTKNELEFLKKSHSKQQEEIRDIQDQLFVLKENYKETASLDSILHKIWRKLKH